ncbi:MAG TPA: response regulator [Candidatus Aquirickettsiella sp.]
MEPEKQKINPQHALLIEDNEACQRIMTHSLQQLNYEVDLADEGEKAVKMAQDKQYDLILTDVRNKGLSGKEVIPLIRNKNKSRNVGTPIIVWSAFVNKKNEEMYLSWGADGALTKPCKIHVLKRAIDECSALQRYERKFRHRIKIIEQEWREHGGQRELLGKLCCLDNPQLSILVDALESIMEYNEANDLSCLPPEKLSTSESSNP